MDDNKNETLRLAVCVYMCTCTFNPVYCYMIMSFIAIDSNETTFIEIIIYFFG